MSETYEFYSLIDQLIQLLEEDNDQISSGIKGEVKKEYCLLVDKEIEELKKLSNIWRCQNL